MTEPVIETATTRTRLRGDGLLVSEALPGTGQSLADAQSNVAAYAELAGDQRRPLMVDLRGARQPVDRDAREYYAGPVLAQSVSAVAMLVSSPVGRVIGSFFLRLTRPVAPIRLFTSEPEAVAWLKTYLEGA